VKRHGPALPDDPYRVFPGRRVRLTALDPAAKEGNKDDPAVARAMRRDLKTLASLQELLYAARTHAVLVVLQGIDTAGKDGTIRHVFSGVNPQGCRVATFGVPSAEEAAHDYLWRVHRETPARGQIAIFNRSHYESVLVERVHGIVPKTVWSARYGEINAFEATLAREGTVILKFFLNLSRAEQKRRLDEREADPDKRWKANPDDWQERKRWDAYRTAFDDMLSKTSTRHAPWHVIPSDHKWYRNLAIASAIVGRLKTFRKIWKSAIRSRGGAEAAEARGR
jgi:PPK2 family polyphosphate:nucleotide phosphotransferase